MLELTYQWEGDYLIPDLDPPEGVASAIAKIAAAREKNWHGYMPNAGYPFARDAMAAKTAKTFEEATDDAVDALKKQLIKVKDKERGN